MSIPTVDIKYSTAGSNAGDAVLPRLAGQQRDWLLLVAYLHLEQGKADRAALLLRILQRAFPDDVEVQRCLALAELLAGQPVAAARAASRAIQRDNGKLRLPLGLVFAKSLWEQGKDAAAREFLSTLLKEEAR